MSISADMTFSPSFCMAVMFLDLLVRHRVQLPVSLDADRVNRRLLVLEMTQQTQQLGPFARQFGVVIIIDEDGLGVGCVGELEGPVMKSSPSTLNHLEARKSSLPSSRASFTTSQEITLPPIAPGRRLNVRLHSAQQRSRLTTLVPALNTQSGVRSSLAQTRQWPQAWRQLAWAKPTNASPTEN